MKYAVFGMIGLFFSGFAPGCGGQSDRADEGEATPAIRTVSQSLSSDPRTRMVQEASYAMWGNHYTYDSTNWPEGNTYATHAYVSQDPGAWALLMSSPTYGYGYYVSCKDNYSPCSITYGPSLVSSYVCQGSCSALARKRGGQCKAFANLVAYRSGIYQLSGYGFKGFPSDWVITNKPVNDPGMPVATYENVFPGDILRKPYGHALIVVKRIDSQRKVIVVDSNWLHPSGTGSGNGHEVVGSHVMSFGDLAGYRVLKCVYDPYNKC